MKVFNFDFQVRGYELDSFGHVNNAVYVNYYEQARWVIMEHLGLLSYFKESGHFLVVVKAQLKYIDELHLLEKGIVKTVFYTEGFFVIFKQEIINKAGKKVNTATFKCLFVNKKREALDIPDILKNKNYDNHRQDR